MKISTLRRSVSGVAAVALVAAGVGLVSTPASAANLGGVSVSPRTGGSANVSTFITPGQCGAAENVKVNVYGGTDLFGGAVVASIPSGTPKNIVGVTAAASFFNASGGMSIVAPQQWSTFASTNGLGALNGLYTLTAVCDSGDTFQGTVTFTGTNVAGATYAAPLNTSTTLAAFSPSSVGFGTPITASATVFSAISGAADSAITGSVDFKEGATTLATGTVNASGVASATLPTSLATGSHTITAVFTPDAAGTSNNVVTSTSGTQSVSVTQGNPAVSVVAPASAAAGDSAAITVNVAPAAAAGTVALAYVSGATTTPLISGLPVSGGVANYTWSISAGQSVSTGNIVATFTPTDSVNFISGNTGSAAFAVTAAAGAINNETIQVTVPAGALSATVVSNPTVELGNWTLDATGRFNVATGNMNPVKVIDTRAGDLGWTLSAKASDFVGCSVYSTAGKNYYNAEPATVYTAASSTALIPGCVTPYAPLAATTKAYQQTEISANNLGILATLAATTTTAAQPGTTFTPNSGVAAQPIIQPDLTLPASAPNTALGLLDSKDIVVGSGGQVDPATGLVVGSATGVVSVNGALTLRVPTVTVSGAYASTLTLTVI